MRKRRKRKSKEENKAEKDREQQEQEDVLKAFTGTVQHYFGGWEEIFKGVSDPRNPEMIIYPLEGLLCTGTLMYLFRLGARREINNKLRESLEKRGESFAGISRRDNKLNPVPAEPGTYKVTLKAGGKIITKALTVRKDPILK